jgi:GNAT superfamily N-acetyltransferase
LIRQAVAADAQAVADIYLAARETALPSVKWAHDGPQVRSWIAETLIPAVGVHVAEEDGGLLGFIALQNDWVAQLYIHPDHWRRGAGTALIDHAKSTRPAGLRLWCFQYNKPAQAFYESHGFVAIDFTDGHGNEEHEPDILYAWPAPQVSAAMP